MPPLQISLVACFDFDPAILCQISNSFAIASIIHLRSNIFFIFIFFMQLRFIDTDKRVIAHSDLNLIYGIDHSIRKRIKGHDEWHCHQISILEPGLGTRQKKNRLVKIMQFCYRLDMLLSFVYLTLLQAIITHFYER